MKRNGLFVHQLAVPQRGSDWHILWYSVIFHAMLLVERLLSDYIEHMSENQDMMSCKWDFV